jgi:hypothetical protein
VGFAISKGFRRIVSDSLTCENPHILRDGTGREAGECEDGGR